MGAGAGGGQAASVGVGLKAAGKLVLKVVMYELSADSQSFD